MSTPGSIKFKQKYSFFKLLAYYTRSKKNKKKSELLSLLCILILGLSPFQLMSLSTIKMVKSDPKLIILSLLPILRLNLWDTLYFVFSKQQQQQQRDTLLRLTQKRPKMNSGKNRRFFFSFFLESDASLDFFNKENKRVCCT